MPSLGGTRGYDAPAGTARFRGTPRVGLMEQVVQQLAPAVRAAQPRPFVPDPLVVIQTRKQATIQRNRREAAACGKTNAQWACMTTKQRRAALALAALAA